MDGTERTYGLILKTYLEEEKNADNLVKQQQQLPDYITQGSNPNSYRIVIELENRSTRTTKDRFCRRRRIEEDHDGKVATSAAEPAVMLYSDMTARHIDTIDNHPSMQCAMFTMSVYHSVPSFYVCHNCLDPEAVGLRLKEQRNSGFEASERSEQLLLRGVLESQKQGLKLAAGDRSDLRAAACRASYSSYRIKWLYIQLVFELQHFFVDSCHQEDERTFLVFYRREAL
ncbi:hypothetical protein RB195_000315 [Necator americanus]|uniref:Uncharacterized protein n=1 Tax=Necator americanus TaxID=51031 RepID=A0ABR1D9T9_NECAM